jgi:hypothetical protein
MKKKLNENSQGEGCGNNSAMKGEWIWNLDGKIPRSYLERYGKLEQEKKSKQNRLVSSLIVLLTANVREVESALNFRPVTETVISS